MIKDLKYLMSYSIALFAFIGISLGGLYNYLAVVFTFVFIPVSLVKASKKGLIKNGCLCEYILISLAYKIGMLQI